MMTCFNRFFGRCDKCIIDYSDNHPNNKDCKYYQEFWINTFEVMEEESSNFNKINKYLEIYSENAMG